MRDRKYYIERIKKEIDDDLMRHIIFNFDDEDESIFLSDNKLLLGYFSNILTFTCLLILNVYLNWKKDINEINDGNNSFWRIYNMLNKAYDPSKLNGEFIDDLIINLEIDTLIDTTKSTSFVEKLKIEDFFNFKSKNNKLTRYIYMLKQDRVSTKVHNTDFTINSLLNCIDMFCYLKKITIKKNHVSLKMGSEINDSFDFIVAEVPNSDDGYHVIDFHESVCLCGTNPAYYMENFSVKDSRTFDEYKKKEQIINLHYISFDRNDIINIDLLNNELTSNENERFCYINEVAIEKFLLNFDIINIHKNNSNSNFFRDYILLNNKYLKDFSYIIADTISGNTKAEIIRKYGSQYSEVFDKMYTYSLYSKQDDFGYKWDEIVLLLLLEEGIYDFLKFLLKYESYDKFLGSFRRRCDNNTINLLLEKEPFLSNPTSRVNSSVLDQGKYSCYANALLVLASNVLAKKDKNLEKSAYPTTIDDVLNEIWKISGSNISNSDKKTYVLNVVLRVLRFLEKFYRGVFNYALNKRKAILELEIKGLYYSNYKKYLKEKEEWIEQIKKNFNSSRHGNFIGENKRVYVLNNKKDYKERITNAFNALIKLNNEYSEKNNSNNEVLFDCTGKRELFSSEAMKNYCNMILEQLKDVDSSLVSLFNKINDFFLYLKTGQDDNQRLNSDTFDIEFSIYPIIGQYYNGVTSTDGYRYSLFKVDYNNKQGTTISEKIKMISEDEFDFGYSYYCVPNINRVATVNKSKEYNSIWISPIIIPCYIYLPQSISELETLDKESDFDEAIELIYESDPFIYENLFGSLSNAKKVMPKLLLNKKSKFYKEHYHIIRRDGKLIAIASIYSAADFAFNKNEIYDAFADASLDFVSDFKTDFKAIDSYYKDYQGKMFWQIDDVCVHKDYRHKSIGRSLIMYLLKIIESKGYSSTLSIYKDNNRAYDLYCSLGFIPVTTEIISDSKQEKEYVKMVKI